MAAKKKVTKKTKAKTTAKTTSKKRAAHKKKAKSAPPKASKKMTKKAAKSVVKTAAKKTAAKKTVKKAKRAETKKVDDQVKAVSSKNSAGTKPKVSNSAKVKVTMKEKKLKAAGPSKSKKREMGADMGPNLARPVKKKRMTKAQLAAAEQMTKMMQKWNYLFQKSKSVKPTPYNMKKSFEVNTPIHHKTLGWGFILNNVNDRLEVLFKDGIKHLISNYKA